MPTTREQFLSEVREGLESQPKTLPCKYFYDERGSQLFDRICELDEYYPTDADIESTEIHLEEIAERLGSDLRLVELGSGSSVKTRLLLSRLELAEYVPVDISAEHLEATADDLGRRYPDLRITPVAADYTKPVDLPDPVRPGMRTVVYFPGSTIGNFHPDAAIPFLSRIRTLVTDGKASGGLLIGVDLRKDRQTLERAYDDREGVTAEFNLNLLRRINAELGADFDLTRFSHRAVWNSAESRIEMHLVSDVDQAVVLEGTVYRFRAGETIRSEVSYKYSREAFASLARDAGFDVDAFWTDRRGLFSLQYLVPRAA